jgi:hypothetical protein
MRWSHVALVCTSAILLAPVASAQDAYSDFRVPEARSFTWLVNGSARWNQQNEAFPGFLTDNRTAVGDLFTAAARHAESEALVSDLVLDLRGTWNTTRLTSSFSDSTGEQARDFSGDTGDYQASATASTTRYLHGSGWGVDAAVDAFYEYSRNANASTTSQASPFSRLIFGEDDVFHSYHGSLDALLGPGYGRVRDVTGVFDMQVLEHRLEATGRLRHPLSPAARQRLAELFSVSGDFLSAHDRPDRYLWREAERILREDDAIEAGTFDAWSLVRALEPATLSIVVTRRAGWRVAAAYEVALDRGHSDADRKSTIEFVSIGSPPELLQVTSGSRTSLDENRGFANASVEYHRPFGMHWQTDFSGTARYGDGPRRQIVITPAVGLTNVLADRWVATATGSLVSVSEILDGARSSPAWTARVTAQLSYFFEDSWSIAAGLDHQRARPLFTDATGVTSVQGSQRQTQLVLALTYRPVGRFEAPGLHVAERLAPGGI